MDALKLNNTRLVVQLVSVKQYANNCNISVSTVRRLIRNGNLEHVRYGRIIRIPADALPKEIIYLPKANNKALGYLERLNKICA